MLKTILSSTLLLGFLIFSLQAQDDWQELFNGKDFSNFEQLNGDATYKIENGEMIGISKQFYGDKEEIRRLHFRV